MASGQGQCMDPSQVYNLTAMRDNLDQLENIPNALIFTNLAEGIFEKGENNPFKMEFETTLQRYDNTIKIAYLKNFRRARVEFSSGATAALAKYDLHKVFLCGTQVKAFFVQIPRLYDSPDKSTLNPPKADKQFLISPPASPPVGWEPIVEHEPVVNYDLLHALYSLHPEGGQHELHSGDENLPKIIVHLTPDDSPGTGPRIRIPQTRRPETLPNGQ